MSIKVHDLIFPDDFDEKIITLLSSERLENQYLAYNMIPAHYGLVPGKIFWFAESGVPTPAIVMTPFRVVPPKHGHKLSAFTDLLCVRDNTIDTNWDIELQEIITTKGILFLQEDAMWECNQREDVEIKALSAYEILLSENARRSDAVQLKLNRQVTDAQRMMEALKSIHTVKVFEELAEELSIRISERTIKFRKYETTDTKRDRKDILPSPF